MRKKPDKLPFTSIFLAVPAQKNLRVAFVPELFCAPGRNIGQSWEAEFSPPRATTNKRLAAAGALSARAAASPLFISSRRKTNQFRDGLQVVVSHAGFAGIAHTGDPEAAPVAGLGAGNRILHHQAVAGLQSQELGGL